MTAYCHIINAKRLLINIISNGEINHFKVALRPTVFNAFFHTVAHTHKLIITNVFMGFITAVIGIGIVMV